MFKKILIVEKKLKKVQTLHMPVTITKTKPS